MKEKDRITQIYTSYSNDYRWKAKYSIFNYEVLYATQELERKKIDILNRAGLADRLDTLKVIDIGGGSGANCLRLIEYGVKPENITFNEIYEPRYLEAVDRLPASCKTILCDAIEIDSTHDENYDLVHLSTVFSSILDNDIRKKLANRVWKLLKRGGQLWCMILNITIPITQM